MKVVSFTPCQHYARGNFSHCRGGGWVCPKANQDPMHKREISCLCVEWKPNYSVSLGEITPVTHLESSVGPRPIRTLWRGDKTSCPCDEWNLILAQSIVSYCADKTWLVKHADSGNVWLRRDVSGKSDGKLSNGVPSGPETDNWGGLH
jgi:hypothetical protein